MMPGFYNDYYQILQTPDHVALLSELIHDVRIIPLDNRPHASSNIRQGLPVPRGELRDAEQPQWRSGRGCEGERG